MADEATAVLEPTTEIVDGETTEAIDAAVAEATKAAEGFFPKDAADVVEAPAVVDPEVVPAEPAEPAEAAPEPEVKPAPEPVVQTVGAEWQAAAKSVWFSDEEIAGFKNDQDAEAQITARRFQALRNVGVDPRELVEFRRQKQAPADAPPATPATPAPAATALEDFKLTIDEDELAPDLVTALRATETYVNQLKATLGTENTQLRQELAGVQQNIQQRAEESNAAQTEAKYAAQWDEAAKAVPGFTEEFGIPTEVRRLPAGDPKVLKIMSFDPYLQSVWGDVSRARAAAGNPRPPDLQSVMADALQQYKLAKGGSATKAEVNGTPVIGAGSVVRSSTRRSLVEPKGDETDQDIDAALKQSRAAVDRLYAQAGGVNPFSIPDQQ